MTRPRLEEIYLLGTGLIGGSLALDMKAAGVVSKVAGFDTDASAASQALTLGILDEVIPPGPDAYQGRLVILSMPVNEIVRVLEDGFPDGTLVTDVGSVKGRLVDAHQHALRRGARYSYVPGHPIAGDEKSGPQAARRGLFNGARVILTPVKKDGDTQLVEELWRAAGSNVQYMEAGRHDAIFGWVSHLPHMAAYSLVKAVLDKDPQWVGFSAGGLRDYTRIAASSPAMWADIAVSNRDVILSALEGLKASLSELEGLVRSGDRDHLESYFEAVARVRRTMA